jgi:phage FluMu protein Com
MAVKMQCPHCKRILNVAETAFGKSLPCPNCKQLVTVPERPTTPHKTVQPDAVPAETEQRPTTAGLSGGTPAGTSPIPHSSRPDRTASPPRLAANSVIAPAIALIVAGAILAILPVVNTVTLITIGLPQPPPQLDADAAHRSMILPAALYIVFGIVRLALSGLVICGGTNAKTHRRSGCDSPRDSRPIPDFVGHPRRQV